MKITAEFNSNEELLSFISTFSAKSFNSSQGVTNTVSAPAPAPVETKKVVKTEDKPVNQTPIVDAEIVSQETPAGNVVDAETITPKDAETTKEEIKEEDPKVTKEMVRERLGVIMKAGKQAEVKALVAKHGASKLPDLKEESYAAVYEEAEALL